MIYITPDNCNFLKDQDRVDTGGYSILDTDQLLEQLDICAKVEAQRIIGGDPDDNDAGIAIVKIRQELHKRGVLLSGFCWAVSK